QQRNNLHHHQLHQNIGGGVGHKRNHSLDGGVDPLSSPTSYLPNGASGGAGSGGGHMTRSLNTNTTSPKLDFSKRHHTRHNSFEGVMSSLPPKPVKCFQQFDQSAGAGYYGGNSEPLDVDADVDDLEDPDDCRDYDEEEFEEDIDDDDDEEEMALNIRKSGGLIADSVMPRPRAMSLEPRKRSGGVQQQHLPTSTGAKQAMAANQKNVVVNRVQKTQPHQQQQQQQQQHLTSPIKRSSSFSVKPNVMKPATPTMSTKTGGLTGVNGRTVTGGSRIQKSASSTSFKKMAAGALDSGVQPQQYHHHSVQPPHHRHQLVMDPNYPDELMLYINDGDDDGLQMRDRRQQDDYSSNSLTDEDDAVDDLDDEDLDVNGARLEKEPLTNTRYYNKTFLMRMEQNKKLAGGGGGGSGVVAGGGSAGSAKQTGGAAACPNTPELPRRAVQMRGFGRDRASMPRDSSLNRMKQDLNLRKSSTGREMLMGGKGQQQQSTQSINSTTSSAVGSGGKVQPKYLDISKYKSSNAANFLKKDESKSYLLRQEGVRKSPSSASVASAMSRTDPTRMSARSIKSASSAASKSSGSGTGAGAVTKKDPVKVAKEQELEMWRRRASYDPMKAALEGKKKQQEESRRLAAAQQQQQTHSERQSKSNESSVLRSQSYHSGVGSAGGGRLYQGNVGNSSNVNLRGAYNQTLGEHPESDNRWTLTSTESSEDLDGDDDYVN
uniref:Uncharacterized protein n=1 Tax=Anopheles maculatus TaxID=74869 RepID=A0A182S8B6_9DIPT